MYEKEIDTVDSTITLEVAEKQVVMVCEDKWFDVTNILLEISDAKRLRNYLTEAINFATLNKEEE